MSNIKCFEDVDELDRLAYKTNDPISVSIDEDNDYIPIYSNSIKKKTLLKTIRGYITRYAYPIGSVYMSVTEVDPSELFGGEWERIQDKFLLSAGSTYSAGTSGGSATHTPSGSVNNTTLTTTQIPSHTHTFSGTSVSTSSISTQNTDYDAGHNHALTALAEIGPNTTDLYITRTYIRDIKPCEVSDAWVDPSDHSKGEKIVTSRRRYIMDPSSAGEVYTDYPPDDREGTEIAIEPKIKADGRTVWGYHKHNISGQTAMCDSHRHNMNHTHNITAAGSNASTGGGGAHNHGFTGNSQDTMPPYLTVYMWKRIS